MSRTCPRCHQPMTATTLPALSGSDGGVKVILDSMPALVCPQGHKRFTSAGFPAELMEALVNAAATQMKPCAESGLLFKRSVCASCREPLPENADATHTKLRIALEGKDPIEAEVTAPMASCAKCGAAQLNAAHALDRGIPAALVRAFESAALQTG